MNPDIFVELSLILVITVFVTGLIMLLKQPAIIGYILSGIVVGPLVLNLISSTETLQVFSHIGVALLLFFVGLNLNPKVVKEVGRISLITGLGQVLFTSGIGFLILKSLGFDNITSLFLSIALAFSSTIVIMKLLSDKKDLETLYGRISVGFLIVQDFIAIFILLILSSLNSENSLATIAVQTLLKGVGAIIVLFAITMYILPKITKIVARSQEYLLLFSLGWCFAIASIFHYLNFSIEAGALLAGISLSMSPYHLEISSRLKSLRDFFLVLFFVLLGSQMIFSNILANIWLILLLSLFVLIGNPIIVMALMGSLGYTKRNSFLAGLTVAQISEFSLVLISIGVVNGRLSNEVLSLVTAVGLVTFAGSSYLIMYSHKIYPKLSKFLTIFEKKGKKVDEHKHHSDNDHDIIMIGYNRVGFDILESLSKIKKKFLIIDYDPKVISKLSEQGFDCRYGDANDSELLNELNFSRAKMVISTVSETDTNLLLISKIKQENDQAIIVVVSSSMIDAVTLYDEGATYVIMPHYLGGKHFSTMIEKNKLSMNKFLKEKIAHLEHIKEKKL